MAVEAQSLAAITQLASNPPSYPRNPTEPALSPLTLYIVRVPGSRDVFLTPLKPRDKVVNAQDVQSSLYFLHIDNPEDSFMSGQHERETSQRSSLTIPRGDEKRHPSVHRKPLPTPPQSPEEGSFDFRPLPVADKHLGVPARKPVIPARNPIRNSLEHRSSPEPPAHRELPSRPPMTTAPSLTLIRRDPATGAQWNVGKIRDEPIEDISSESVRNPGNANSISKSSGAPIYLDISNPGYSRFIQSDLSRPTSSHDLTTELPSLTIPTDNAFHRRMWMDGSRFADHSYTRRKHTSQTDGSQGKRSSVMSLQSALQAPPSITVDQRSRGYAFYSPWGGKCEFSTGGAGRSLKCKHRVESTGSHVQSAANVSELRFNLPSGMTRSGSTNNMDTGSESTKAPYLGHRHTRSEPGVDMEPHWTTVRDENGDIDYSLGRERAGGGFGGKQAKLGKLIVEDEGQKMLDLVVAANLALWWRAYEKTS